MKSVEFDRILEVALKRTDHRFPILSKFREQANPRHYLRQDAPGITAHTMFLMDVTISDHIVRLIESNGSNGALSSTSLAGDWARVEHMVCAFESKARPPGQVVVTLCHQEGFLHLPEFFSRAQMFAEEISKRHKVELRDVSHDLGKEDVTVVCGSTAAVAKELSCRDMQLYFKGRPVIFACNANLLPEGVRRGTIGCDGGIPEIDLTIFHEGHSTPIVHDKAIQQEIARGTGIEPLASRLVNDRQGWLAAVQWFQGKGMPCVAKMHAGSGGAGIEIITPEMNADQCENVLEQLLASARNAYGPKVEETAFPIALFEFAIADPIHHAGRPHLWDLRIAAYVSPNSVTCHACVGRLCPAPFDDSWARDTWVNNLSGRDGNQAERFLRAPSELGLSNEDIHRMLEASAKWASAAARFGEHATNQPVQQ